MREFNLEEAKAGANLCTREGGTARIISFNCDSEQPIVALIRDVEEVDKPQMEYAEMYYSNGRLLEDEFPHDLMMVD